MGYDLCNWYDGTSINAKMEHSAQAPWDPGVPELCPHSQSKRALGWQRRSSALHGSAQCEMQVHRIPRSDGTQVGITSEVKFGSSVKLSRNRRGRPLFGSPSQVALHFRAA